MDMPGVLRDVVIGTRAHVLARRVAGVAPASDTAARDAQVQLAYERGLADGRALAAKLAQEEAERAIAERVREEVAASLADAHEAARQEGLEAGLSEANAVLERERATATARLESMLAEIAAQTLSWMRGAEEELILLAHDAASRIVAEAAIHPEPIRLLVRRLLEARTVDEAELLHVHVHPDDFAAFDTGETPQGWRWVSDASIVLGGVCLRSPHGSFDARLETQFAALGELLRAARARRDGDAA